jgi:hypothetical protein
MKTLLKIFGVFAFLIVMILVWYDQSRSFYCISENQFVTIWKRLGNKCLIIPDKYYGINLPQYYIKTTNDNALTIIFDYPLSHNITISNDYGKNTQINLGDKKFLYFNYDKRDVFLKEFYFNNQIRSSLKYIQMDIKEDLVVVNGVQK